MTFKKGHPPYPKKQATEMAALSTKPQKSDVQVATDLLEGVTLSPMNPNQTPPQRHEDMRQPVRRAVPASPSAPTQEPLSSDDLQSVLPLLVRALERLAEGQEGSQEAAKIALERAHRAQFPQGVKRSGEVSMFNPQGETEFPRPDLKCRMFLPWQAEKETLTVEEIHLLNLLEEGDYKVKRNDGSKMTVTVRIQMNANTGRPERLLMNSETGFSNLRHRQVVPLAIMLREMLNQRPHLREPAAAVATMDQMYESVASGELPISKSVEY